MGTSSSRPTIVQVIDSGLQKHGSFEDFMIQLAARSTAAGLDLHFVFPRVESPAVRKLIEAAGATVWTVAGPWNTRSAAREMIATLRSIRPRVADFHFCGAGALLRVYIACRLAGTKVLHHYHGEIRPLSTLRWRNRQLSSLRLLSFFVDRFVAVSRANAAFLRALHVRGPVDVIYNGIDIERFRAAGSARTTSSTVRLLSVGSIIQRKRVDILLQAFARLRETNSHVSLTIVGGGAEEARCRQLATELGLNGSVTFTGLVPDFPFQLLSDADIFVSASESESFGLMFAEAMCFSVPVVACDVGGIPEVVLNNATGLLVPAGDPDAFAEAMRVLVANPDQRKRMGDAALVRVRQQFELAPRVDDLVLLLAETARAS